MTERELAKEIEAIPARVAAGVRYLDATEPEGWRGRIDLETFRIVSPCKCVLGQLHGSAYKVFSSTDRLLEGQTLTQEQAAGYGFDSPAGGVRDCDDYWHALGAEWVRVLSSNLLKEV